jgi:argininosuccinate synthase
MKRVVLAYSGGLHTSIAIPWLIENHDVEVITVTLDVGQGRELADVRERALALGATRAHVIDAREEFVREYILPALQAGALYEQQYPLATALAGPLVARRLVDLARMEGATTVAHGCTGHGNDQVRLEVSLRALEPSLNVLAPARKWRMSRTEALDFARTRNIPVPAANQTPYSVDANLWGRSIAGGELEDPFREPPEHIYTLTRAPQDCADEPAYVDIEFDAGVPVRANGVDMSLLEMIESLETIAGAHGVGRIDMIENRLLGTQSREIYEAPAAVVLHAAHKELEKLVVARELERLKHDLALRYADLVYNGLWFSQTREAIDALVAAVQARVAGTVRLKLFKGTCQVAGRKSPFALHDWTFTVAEEAAATDGLSQAAAEGFIRIWGLPAETAARRRAITHTPVRR